MDFINDTNWEARLFTGSLDDEQLGGWMVARATFRVDRERGRLIPTEVRWPVFHERVHTRYGTFPSDNYPMHRGCDLVVLGRARYTQPTARGRASFKVGEYERAIEIVGNRRWARAADKSLVPTAPEPFTEMGLDWTNAYGGLAVRDGEQIIHPMNPIGRGVYLDEESAEGQGLPNLEDPDEPIRRWSDAPTPAAWGPVERAQPWQMQAAIRRQGWTESSDPTRAEFMRVARSCTPAAAVPRNVCPSVLGDEDVTIALGDDRWSFTLPGWRFQVRVDVGAERSLHRVDMSGLWFLADTQLLVATFRSRWRYLIRPRETRTATLLAQAA